MVGANTREFTDDNFEQEVLSATEPVLVDFSAEWCGPCKALGPVIDALATEYAGRVKIGAVDVDKNQSLAVKYGISAIPTVLLFQNGQVTQKFYGLAGADKKKLKMSLDQVVTA